jgi:hypothetical protein
MWGVHAHAQACVQYMHTYIHTYTHTHIHTSTATVCYKNSHVKKPTLGIFGKVNK